MIEAPESELRKKRQWIVFDDRFGRLVNLRPFLDRRKYRRQSLWRHQLIDKIINQRRAKRGDQSCANLRARIVAAPEALAASDRKNFIDLLFEFVFHRRRIEITRHNRRIARSETVQNA